MCVYISKMDKINNSYKLQIEDEHNIKNEEEEKSLLPKKGTKFKKDTDRGTSSSKIVDSAKQLHKILLKEKTLKIEEIKKLLDDDDSGKLLTYKYFKPDYRSIFSLAKNKSIHKGADKQNILNTMLDCGFRYYKKLEDKKNLLFFASALGHIEELSKVVPDLDKKTLNDTREGYTVLSFVLQYGDLSNKYIPECVKILIEAGVNINKTDYDGVTPITAALQIFKQKRQLYKNNLEEIISMMVKKGLFRETITYKHQDVLEQQFGYTENSDIKEELSKEEKLFKFIVEGKSTEFVRTLTKKFVDIDDGESTLLQLAVIKCNIKFVEILLTKQANPNLTTTRNIDVPLFIAAKTDQDKVFHLLLKNKSLQIDQDLFDTFIVHNSYSFKIKYFNAFLGCDKLDCNLKSTSNNTTPLQYAIYFSNSEAIQKLLKRGASLTTKNIKGNSALSVINCAELETYFNSCVIGDNYKDDLSDREYKCQFEFRSLIGVDSETDVVSEISENSRLKDLLQHPLLYAFINLKWQLAKSYYKLLISLKSILYILLASILFKANALNNTYFFIGYIILILIYIPFLLLSVDFRHMKNNTLHSFIDLGLLINLIFVLIDKFRVPSSALAFVIMAISLLFTLGYHLKLSKWSAMLQKVFRTFSSLLTFFLIPVIAFSISFHILHSEDHEKPFFRGIFSAIFKTFVMLTGEFNLEEPNFPFIMSFVIFTMFSMGMTIILMNFWTGVAVSDIEKIEKKSIVVAYKNVIVFLRCVELTYTKFKYLPLLEKMSPLLFPENVKKNEKTKKYNYRVDFYINDSHNHFRNDKFENLQNRIVDKIKNYFETSAKETIDDKIDNMVKIIHQLQNKIEKLEKSVRDNEINK